MITSLPTALGRVLLFWYVLGVLFLFLGDPAWAEACYVRLSMFPWVPEINAKGLFNAAHVQETLLFYWTVPLLLAWACCVVAGLAFAEVKVRLFGIQRDSRLKPSGQFCKVKIDKRSLGALPMPVVPAMAEQIVRLPGGKELSPGEVEATLKGSLLEVSKMLTPAERAISEELLRVLMSSPEHFCGMGHGVGLLEHTLNVAAEAATRCTSEFRLPFVAALAHDVGKLTTFIPDGNGGWQRRGYHSRESARILASLPSFGELPLVHQRGLLLAVKYDHSPSKIPTLHGDTEATLLASRIMTALAHADKTATAAEKDRNLEKMQPEDLLWQDFKSFLREAPVVQRGKPGSANQVNNPDGPFVYLYEAPWRDAAVRRLPPEVAAALDLDRRDAGKLAKYTRILIERLRKEGILVEEHEGKAVPAENPLWDIQSGTGEKAVTLRGILVLNAAKLWNAVNYRLGTKSPYPVQVLAPNAGADGSINPAPSAADAPPTPDITDGMKVDPAGQETMATFGLADGDTGPARRKVRGRKGLASAPSNPVGMSDDMLGLAPAPAAPAPVEPVPAPPVMESESSVVIEAPVAQSGEQVATIAEDVALGGDVPWEEATVYQEEPVFDDSPYIPDEPAPEPVVLVDEPMAAEPQPVPEPPAPAAPEEKKAPAKKPDAGLSRTEKMAGIAVADAAACAKYPHLNLGDKYYTEKSKTAPAGQPFVTGAPPVAPKQATAKPAPGAKPAPAPAKQAQPSASKVVGLGTDSGPRRSRRKLT